MKGLLYFPKEDVFHIEPIGDTCAVNFDALSLKDVVDGHIIAVGTRKELKEKKKEFKGILRSKVIKGILRSQVKSRR